MKQVIALAFVSTLISVPLTSCGNKTHTSNLDAQRDAIVESAATPMTRAEMLSNAGTYSSQDLPNIWFLAAVTTDGDPSRFALMLLPQGTPPGQASFAQFYTCYEQNGICSGAADGSTLLIHARRTFSYYKGSISGRFTAPPNHL